MAERPLILVMGAGGRIGAAVAAGLSAVGASVRTVHHDHAEAREAREAGRDAVAVELDEPSTLEPALEGVDTLFLLTAETPDQARQEGATIEAAQAASVRRVVKASVWRAEDELTEIARLHRAGEKALEASSMAWTFLRPTTYMQNFLLDAGAIHGGVLAQPASDAPVGFVDDRDVARVAVAILTGDGHDGRAYPLTGPEALTNAEVADTFARVLGHPVDYRPLSDEEMRSEMRDADAPGWQIEMLSEVADAYRDGGRSELTPYVERFGGQPPTSLECFIDDHRQAFRHR